MKNELDNCIEISQQNLNEGISTAIKNVGNSLTIGYKREETMYGESFTETLQDINLKTDPNKESSIPGCPNQIIDTRIDRGQGSLMRTSNPADCAIQGEGHFAVKVENENSVFATRNGAFEIDEAFNLVTIKDGHKLQGTIYASDQHPTYTVNEVQGELVFIKDTPPTSQGKSTIGNINLNYELKINKGITLTDSIQSFTEKEIEAAAPKVSSFYIRDNGKVDLTLSNGDSLVRAQVLLIKDQDIPKSLNMKLNCELNECIDIDKNRPGVGSLGQIKSRSLEQSNVDLTDEINKIMELRSVMSGLELIKTFATNADPKMPQT